MYGGQQGAQQGAQQVAQHGTQHWLSHPLCLPPLAQSSNFGGSLSQCPALGAPSNDEGPTLLADQSSSTGGSKVFSTGERHASAGGEAIGHPTMNGSSTGTPKQAAWDMQHPVLDMQQLVIEQSVLDDQAALDNKAVLAAQQQAKLHNSKPPPAGDDGAQQPCWATSSTGTAKPTLLDTDHPAQDQQHCKKSSMSITHKSSDKWVREHSKDEVPSKKYCSHSLV